MRLFLAILLAGTCAAADLTIAAASDLARLGPALKDAYGQGLRFSFGSSGSLLRQIENGAPFDVFLSANDEYVIEGIEKQVLFGPPQSYAQGRIALWSRSRDIRTLEQLRSAKVLHIAIANPAYAPYGAAAKQALEKSGMWAVLQPRLVFGENIRQTLQYAESGNADAAIVSWSLVHDRGGVLLPDSLHAPILQTAAMVKSTKQGPAAAAFLRFLLGPKGRAVLQANGLFPPPAK